MKEFFRKNRDNSVLALLFALCLLMLWFSGRTSLSGPQQLGLAAISFGSRVSTAVGTFFTDTVTAISRISQLQKENLALVERIKELEAQQSELSILKIENKQLRDVLQFNQLLGFQNVPVRMIGKTPGALFQSITIDKGYNSGIRKGMPVIGIQNGIQGLVGRIERVSPDSALVQPLFSEDFFVAGRLQSSRFEGLVQGGGFASDPLVMKYVDLEAETLVKVDEMIITSGVNSKYPPGLSIGKVSAINARSYENSLELHIKPTISFATLEYMYVILAYAEPE